MVREMSHRNMWDQSDMIPNAKLNPNPLRFPLLHQNVKTLKVGRNRRNHVFVFLIILSAEPILNHSICALLYEC